MLSIEKRMTKDEAYYMIEITGSILANLSLTQLLNNQMKMLHLHLNQKSKKIQYQKEEFENHQLKIFSQFSSVSQSCLTLCDAMNRSTPGLPVHHQLLGYTQTHVHWVSDATQPSHPLSSPSPLAPNPSQHQSLFQWVNSSHEVAKVLEFQL